MIRLPPDERACRHSDDSGAWFDGSHHYSARTYGRPRADDTSRCDDHADTEVRAFFNRYTAGKGCAWTKACEGANYTIVRNITARIHEYVRADLDISRETPGAKHHDAFAKFHLRADGCGGVDHRSETGWPQLLGDSMSSFVVTNGDDELSVDDFIVVFKSQFAYRQVLHRSGSESSLDKKRIRFEPHRKKCGVYFPTQATRTNDSYRHTKFLVAPCCACAKSVSFAR
jgi:hypothetical protein